MSISLPSRRRKAPSRVMVAISKDVHDTHSRIAELLGIRLRSATDTAVQDWNKRHAPLARSKAKELTKRIP